MLTPTGVTTSDYISALKAGLPVHIKMTFDHGTVLTDDDINFNDGLVINDILNGDTDLCFGKAVMKQITVGIFNTSNLNGIIWSEPFTLELGVEVSGSTNYVQIGRFVGERPNKVKNVEVIQFTANDLMSKFDIPVDEYWHGIEYPTTIGDIYHGLCTFVGIGYINGNELPNMMSRTITSVPAQIEGYTCRDLLAWIAEAVGCYARIDAYGRCKMVWFSDQTSTVSFSMDDEFAIESDDITNGMTWDEFDTYTWDDADTFQWRDVCSFQETYGIDCLQVKEIGSDADTFYPIIMNGNNYVIIENPFLFTEGYEDVENYIKPIYDRIQLFGGHVPVRVQCVGNYLVESGDIITVSIDSNTTIDLPVYCRTFKWNGSCIDTYEITGSVNRSTNTSAESKEKLISRNRIQFFARDLYYNRQSGVEIDSDGVTVSGSRYIKIESGGVLDVSSDNFSINSETKEMIAGKWHFTDDGMTYEDPTSPFKIANFLERTNNYTGVFYQQQTSHYGEKLGKIYIGTKSFDRYDSMFSSYISYVIGYDENTDTMYSVFCPDREYSTNGIVHCIGTSNGGQFDDANILTVHCEKICADEYTPYFGLHICPDGEETEKAAVFLNSYDENTGRNYIAIEGTDDDGLSQTDVAVRGFIEEKITRETDFNDIDESGSYWVKISDMQYNIPSGLTTGRYLLNVYRYHANSNGHLYQILHASNVMYTRMLYDGTWSSWYRFVGTQL